MTEHGAHGDVRSIWHGQDEDNEMTFRTMDTATLIARDTRLTRRVRRRNLLEYVAGSLAAALFLALALGLLGEAGGVLARAGAALLVAGLCYAGVQLRLRARALPDDPGAPSVPHYLEGLRRQRDALRAVWKWYLLPLVPGFLLFYAGQGTGPDGHPAAAALSGAVTLGVIVGVALLNRRAARCIDGEIADIARTLDE